MTLKIMDYPEDIIYLQIAGFILKIIFEKTEWPRVKKTIKREILNYCGGFEITKESKVNYTIYFIQRKNNEIFIKQEEKKYFINLYEFTDDSKLVTFYQISIIHFLLILRIVLNKLLSTNNGFIIHSSASYINNKACLFLGDDGAGKSTAVKLIKPEYFPLTDDMSIIRKEGEKFYLYQTPFLEKNQIKKTAKAYVIGGIFFIIKDKLIRVKKISNKEVVLNNILDQIASGQEEIEKCFKEITQFANDYNFFYLHFNLQGRELINFFRYENTSHK